MKPIYLLFFIISVSPLTSFGQYFTIDTVKGESPYNQVVSFIFPRLTSAGKPGAADSINRSLIRNVLVIEPGTQKYSIFEKVWGAKPMDIPNVGDISFKVINNDADFFCISITASICTESCRNITRYYTYESSSGREIQFEQLFSKDGIQTLSDSVHDLTIKRIQEYTDTLKYAIANKPLSDDDKRDYKTAIDLYAKCKQEIELPQVYSLDKAQITIYTSMCLPPRLFFIDKIDRNFSFDLNRIKNYLTDYGKSLLKP
jgi:hypothetical protein